MKRKSVGQKLIVTAVFMIVATLLSKVLGQVRDSLLTAFFGAGIESDAFYTASTIPTTLFDVVVGGVISATFIPVFNNIMAERSKDEAMVFVNKFVTMILCITVIISVAGILLRTQLAHFMAPNYDGEKQQLTANLTAIMFPMIIFTGLAFSFVGLLQSFGEYNIPSIISLVSNLAIIVYYVTLGKKFGIYGLAVTMIIAWSLQFLIEVPWIKKFGVRFRPDFRFKDKYIIQAVKLAGPMLIATWVQPLYTIVNQRLASNIDSAVTYMQQSSRLYLIVTGVVSFVITNLIFPKLAQAVANKKEEETKKLFSMSIRSMFMLILPLMAGFMILSYPVASIIFHYGKMTNDGILAISTLLKFYLIGMAGLAINEVLSKTFFAMSESKIPMINSILSMIVNIVLAYVLFGVMQTNGLAIATACGSICNAVLNAVSMHRKYPGMMKRTDFKAIFKSILATAVMAAAVWTIYSAVRENFVGLTGNIAVIAICGASGIIIYALMLLIISPKETKKLLKRKG